MRYAVSKRRSRSCLLFYCLAHADVLIVLDIFFVRALSDHLGPSSPVVVNNPDPGLCYSELRREISSIFVSLFERLLAHTAEEGSRQLVYAAVSGVDSEMHGAYVALSQIKEVSDFVLSAEGREAQRRIWVSTSRRLSLARE